MSKLNELLEEFNLVLSVRKARLLDSFAPLLIFLVVNALVSLNYALWGSLGLAGLLAIYRLVQREYLVYALGGFGGVVVAAAFVKISGSGAGFFLPGLISSTITVMLCAVSVALNRPLVAWTSFISRRWPLNWYWHPRVLPAYNEVTILWAVAFAGRLVLELWLYQRGAFGELGAARIILGWPFIIVLLVASYLYGLWRLGRLQGPSIEEFRSGKEPPWEGQRRGF